MPRRLKISFILIAFFLSFAGTWEKPQQIEKKTIYDTKTAEKYDKARSIYVGKEPEGTPPKGWFWWKNAKDFKMSSAWSEPAKRRFQSLIASDTIPDTDRRSMLKWVRPKIDLDTPWIDAKTGDVANYIMAKVDTFKLFTVFKLCDPAGNPLNGTVEQDFKGQAKIYNLDRDSQYKIACFDSNGVVGTSVTALTDRYVRVYDYQSGTSIVAGKFIAENQDKDTYIESQYAQYARCSKIDANGRKSWEKDISTYVYGVGAYWNEIMKGHALTITGDDYGIWAHDRWVWPGGNKWLRVEKLDMSTGNVALQMDLDVGNVPYEYCADVLSDAYHVHGNDTLYDEFSEHWLFDISSGVSKSWKINSNGPVVAYDNYLKCYSSIYDKRNDSIVCGGYDLYGMNILDYRSGVTIASNFMVGQDPRFAFEETTNEWSHTGQNEYVGYDWGASNKKTIDRLYYYWGLRGLTPSGPEVLLIQGSNDLAAWTTLLTLNAIPGSGSYSGFSTFANTTAYRAYRGYYNNCISSDPSYPGAWINIMAFGEGSSGGPRPTIFAMNASEGSYQNLRGRIKWKADFSTDGVFSSICIGQDGTYTAVGAVTGYVNTFVANVSPSGVTNWEHTYDIGNYPKSIVATSDKGYIVSGSLGNPNESWNAPLAFLLKIDKNGNEEWRKYFTPNVNEGTVFYRAVETIDKGFLAVGGHRLSATESQVYIVKTNRHGESCSPGVPCE